MNKKGEEVGRVKENSRPNILGALKGRLRSPVAGLPRM